MCSWCEEFCFRVVECEWRVCYCFSLSGVLFSCDCWRIYCSLEFQWCRVSIALVVLFSVSGVLLLFSLVAWRIYCSLEFQWRRVSMALVVLFSVSGVSLLFSFVAL